MGPRTAVARALVVCVLVVAACSGGDDPAPSDRSDSAGPSTTTTRPGDTEGTARWRPATHYTPERHWMSDPTGLVFHDGTWHLFFQHNPEGIDLGNISWGHATSTDLVTWADRPVAIEATDDELVFAGSVVVDHGNSSGFGTGDDPPLVAVYTSVFGEGSGLPVNTQAQSLAYSTDRGDTWQRYDANPVLRLPEPEARGFRDPKVFWYEPGGYWVMVAIIADARVVKLFRSDDLKDWTALSELPAPGIDEGLIEVPDLFPLPLDGDGGGAEDRDGGEERWVLVVNLNGGAKDGGSGARYVVGDFDGTTFRPDDPAGAWVDEGPDFYAAGTWNEAPDGERIAVAWMSNWAYAGDVPTEPWRGTMTTPRRLALRTIDGQARLVAEPVVAERRPEPAYEQAAVEVDDAAEVLPAGAEGAVADVELVVEPGTAELAEVVVHRSPDGSVGTRITYDPAAATLTVDRSRSGVTDFSPRFATVHRAAVPAEAVADGLDLRILLDRSSVEVFAAGGAVTFSEMVLPAEGSDGIALVAQGGSATFRDVAVRHP